MDEILNFLKTRIAYLWKPAKTSEEKVIKRYDILIAICVVFMLVYSSIFIFKLEKKFESGPSIVINTQPLNVNDPNYNDILFLTTNMVVPTITSEKTLPPDEFFKGEIVGIKYFGIYGLVTEKTLGTEGYKYKVRWKDNSHGLPTDEFLNWELYRPSKNSVPISALQN